MHEKLFRLGQQDSIIAYSCLKREDEIIWIQEIIPFQWRSRIKGTRLHPGRFLLSVYWDKLLIFAILAKINIAI